MLTCKEASHLASKAMDAKLTWRERVGLWLHIALCDLCRRYIRDIKKLHALTKKAGRAGEALLPESVKLSEQSRERIKRVLKKALDTSE
ncbi:MAG: anti-sigma factor family protein [Gammaproteobacteria bacterium]